MLVALCLPVSYFIGGKFCNVLEDSKKDELTGLYTRKHTDLVSNMVGTSKKMIIFLIDIDNFKKINDIHGHNTGDEVLKSVSNVLQKSIRKNDFAMRWGGDEFIVAYNSDLEPEVFSERINAKMDDVSKMLGIPIVVSKGISSYPKDANTFDELVAIADKRMYANKKSK
jgi:diguanylate cyclase (GGDEF)-like protein